MVAPPETAVEESNFSTCKLRRARRSMDQKILDPILVCKPLIAKGKLNRQKRAVDRAK
jgi:hypothetical protein